MRSETASWLGVSRLPGISARRALRLQQAFGSGSAVWEASASDLQSVLQLETERLSDLLARRQQLDPEALLTRVERAGGWVISIQDADYPEQLRELFDPPTVVYGLGSRPQFGRPQLAIVGARRMTSYGKQVIESFMADLAPAHPVVVSGLARGVDGQSHQSALQHELTTWAVLGSGFGQIYPPEHKQLALKIVHAGGTLLSEYWPDEQPMPYHFPARNRIIAALANVVLVVEADEKSGSLITVDHALDLGREVFAVPGNLTSRQSRGTNLLLRQGAGIALSAQDILAVWGLGMAERRVESPLLMPVERQIFLALDDCPQSFDQLVQETGLPTAEILAAITTLEIRGLVLTSGDQSYRRGDRYEVKDSR